MVGVDSGKPGCVWEKIGHGRKKVRRLGRVESIMKEDANDKLTSSSYLNTGTAVSSSVGMLVVGSISNSWSGSGVLQSTL